MNNVGVVENNAEMMMIKELVDKLNYHTKLYDQGKPIISDEEWDKMYFELVKLENFHKCYWEDSPTQRINFQTVSDLKKITHEHPMLSLDKTKDIEDVKKFIGKKDSIAMLKMDGLTCSLTYENGYLVRAETRGNGVVGEDVLHNVFQIKNVPNRIDYKDRLVIDGEIICTYRDFVKFGFNQEYKNPRNFASGSIRLLNSEESAMRQLRFIAWDVIEGLNGSKTLSEKISTLHSLNFTIVPFYCDKEIEESINMLKEAADVFSYPFDGVVFKYDNIEEYLAAGRTDHHFKGGLAYKFYDESYETTLKTIEWTMGRTGVLTPVAVFEPIDIDGSTVERASLHNLSIMEDLSGGFERIGDTLYIFKANQIIPQVSSWEHNDDYNEATHLSIPETCPICGGQTVVKQENDSKVLMCDNPNCDGKLINRFDHFCGKKGLDIKGLSKATLEKLLNWGFIHTYQDIFLLYQYREAWIKKPGFGVASVDRLLNAIKEAKTPTLAQVISAAGIPGIGSRVAQDLAKHYNDWWDFRNETNFLKYDGIGEVMNNNLLTFDYEDLNLDYTVNLHLNKAQKKEEIKENADTEKTLNNLAFCITGKLGKVFKNRAELESAIKSKGGTVKSSVTKNVNYLIANEREDTTKYKTAESLGIKIITEVDFWEQF